MTIRQVPGKLDAVVLVCAKCSKKLGGGFGPKGRTPLAKALRKAMGKSPLRAVPVKCMGVCPKGAVTLFDPRHPGEWMLVKEETPLGDIVLALGRSGQSEDAR